MKTAHRYILDSIKRVVKGIDPDSRVILYGSRARGDEHEFSDWDLLILTPHEASLSKEQQFRHPLFDLEVEYGQAFSTMLCSEEQWESKYFITPLYESIAEEGLLV